MCRIFCIFVVLAMVARGIFTENDFVTKTIHEAQREIMDSVAHNLKRESNSVNVTSKKIYEEILLTNSSWPIFPFEANGKVYILIGNNVLGVDHELHLTQQVATVELNGQENHEATFIKVVEWQRILFLLVAFKQGYCRLYTASPDMRFVLRQTIHNFGQAQDAEFFKLNNELFLVLIMQESQHLHVHSFIYRWSGTHLDETETFTTSGAIAVCTFPTPDAVMIVVAQNLPNNPMVGSQVLRLQDKKLERVQFLATNAPLLLSPYIIKGQQYLLLVNERAPSATYWWSGSEFLPWESIPNLHGKYDIVISNNADEQHIYLLQNKTVIIYNPSELHFRAVTKLTIPSAQADKIISVVLVGKAQDVLLFISKKDDTLSLHVLKISFVKNPSGAQIKGTDPLLECLIKLEKKLEEQQRQIKYIKYISDKLLLTNEATALTGKLDVHENIKVKNLSTNETFVPPNNHEKIIATSSDIINTLENIDSKISSANNQMDDLVLASTPGNMHGNIIIEGDLLIKELKSHEFTANNINGRNLDPHFLLTYLGNETLNDLFVDTLVVHNLHAPSVFGKNFDNVLVTKGDQVFTSKMVVSDVVAKSAKLAKNMLLEEKSRSDTSNSDNVPIIQHIKATNISVDTINQNNIKGSRDNTIDIENAKSVNKDVTITHLTVNTINGINWNDFISSLFLKSSDQTIQGDLRISSGVHINNLTVLMINSVLNENWMTKSSDQNIEAATKIKHVKTVDVVSQSINNLDLSNDVVRTNMDNVISGGVTMTDVTVLGKVVTQDKVQAEGFYPKQNNIMHIYTGKVTINGDMQVDDIEFGNSIGYVGSETFKFSEISNQYWTKSTNQTVAVGVNFLNSATMNSNIYSELINGYPVSEYVHFGSSELHANLFFGNVRVHDNLMNANSGKSRLTVSGVDLKSLDQEVVRLNGEFTIQGAKMFSGGLSTSLLKCKTLNNITSSDAVDVNSSKLQINGTKYFTSLAVEGNILSDGPINVNMINNEQLSEKINSMVFVDEPLVLENVDFENVKASAVQTTSLNGQDMESIVNDRQENWNESISIEIRGNVEFRDELNLDTINQIRYSNYISKILSKSAGGVLDGNLTVHGNLVLQNLHSDVCNSVNVHHLQTAALSRKKEQSITGHYTIDRVWTDYLDADIISGIDMQKLININNLDAQIIHGRYKFHNVKFLKLYAHYVDGCAISKALESLSDMEGDRNFDAMDIEGSLNWQHDVPQHKILSYIFANAVNRYENQTISGKVTWNGKVAAETMVTKNHINGVDLEAIVHDALFKFGEYQEVSCPKKFMGKISIDEGKVLGNAVIDIVNDIDVLSFNQSLVRTNQEERKIKGHKHFINGFSADEFTCYSQINGIDPSHIATYDSTQRLSVHFEKLDILEDLNIQNINSIDINNILLERVTLSSPQHIEGNIVFKNNLRVYGNTMLERVNDVVMTDVMYTMKTNNEPQTMYGIKTFTKNVELQGNLEAAIINDFNTSYVFASSLFIDEDAVIDGDMIFSEDVAVNNKVDVSALVNDIKIEDLPRLVQLEAINNMHHINTYSKDIELSMKKTQSKTQDMASELMYLEEVGVLPLSGVRRASASVVGPGVTMLNTHGWNEPSQCGLPMGCLCPQQNIIMFTQHGVISLNTLQNSRQFYYIDDKKPSLAVRVTTNTLSLSQRCRVQTSNIDEFQENTGIRWIVTNINSDPFFNDIGSFHVIDSAKQSFVSDVKGFKMGTTTFIIVALSYDPYKDTHDVDSLVLRMNPREHKPKVIQTIATNGARLLELVHHRDPTIKSAPLLHLVVGNTFNSEQNHSNVDLHIYRFDAKQEKFYLIRSYPTHGSVAMQSLVLGNDIYVLIAQQSGAPLVILKYNHNLQNYYFFQEIRFEAQVLDIGVFYVGGDDAYFGVITENGMVHIYKYAFIEGFKLIVAHASKDAQGFTPFSVNGDHFVFLPSKENSKILRIVTQGT